MTEAESEGGWPLSHLLEVARLPSSGAHVVLDTDEAARAAVASRLGILAVDSLQARMLLTPRGKRVAVKGRVTALVRQACVVTLEPVEEKVDEEIDLVFATPDEVEAAEAAAFAPEKDGERQLLIDPAQLMDPNTLPEPIVNGRIDAWVVAQESLSLGLNPYPRKPGAEFVQPNAPEPEPSPFAALAKLRKE